MLLSDGSPPKAESAVPLLYCGDWYSDPPFSTSDSGVTGPGIPEIFWPVVIAYNWIRSRICGERIAMSMLPPNPDLAIWTIWFNTPLSRMSTP